MLWILSTYRTQTDLGPPPKPTSGYVPEWSSTFNSLCQERSRGTFLQEVLWNYLPSTLVSLKRKFPLLVIALLLYRGIDSKVVAFPRLTGNRNCSRISTECIEIYFKYHEFFYWALLTLVTDLKRKARHEEMR